MLYDIKSNVENKELDPMNYPQMESEGGYEKSPERSLLAALLYRSILDYLDTDVDNSCKQRRRLLKNEAKVWLFKENHNAAIPFKFVCEELNVCPNALRKALMSPDTRQRLDHMRFYL